MGGGGGSVKLESKHAQNAGVLYKGGGQGALKCFYPPPFEF